MSTVSGVCIDVKVRKSGGVGGCNDCGRNCPTSFHIVETLTVVEMSSPVCTAAPGLQAPGY